MPMPSLSSALALALTRARAAGLLCGLVLTLLHALAWGHATKLSSTAIEVGEHGAAAVLELNAQDVDFALKTALLQADGAVSASSLESARPAIEAYVLEHARLAVAPDAPCRGAVDGMRPKGDHVLVDLRWSCPPVDGDIVYQVSLFHDIDAAARHMVTASGAVKMVGLLSVSNPVLTLAPSRSDVWRVMWHYLLAGIEHIAIGYDHIAFLVAVIVWGRKLWPLVKVVTAFTVAHSITLSLAVLDIVRLPSLLVETLIALSIVYVAAENFFVRDMRHRAWITFGFGLVHGFGFASVLRDYGLPQDALVPALAAFNVGVEVGQVAIVGIAFALFLLANRLLRDAKGALPAMRAMPLVLSALILLLGVYWTIERVLGA